MAKFGSDVTTMSPANTGAAGQILGGVQDNSTALRTAATTGLIENAGKLAVDAYHGYNLADVEKENQKIVAEAETGLLAKSIFKTPLAEDELDPVLKAYGLSTKKYVNALQQGVMSPYEFETRTLANLRSAVNRNPNMRDELTKHTKDTLELTGMSSALKQEALTEKTAAESADAYMKQVDSGLAKENIFLPNTTPLYEKERVLMGATKDTKAYEVWKRAKDYKSQFTEEQALNWVEGNGFNAVNGGISEWNKTIVALGITAEGQPETFPNIVAKAKLQAPIQKELFASGIDASLRQNPLVKEKIEAYNKAIDDSLLVLDKLGSGDDWKKAVSNRLEITKSMQEQGLRDRYNIAELDFVIKGIASDPNGFALAPKTREVMRTTFADLVSGNYNSSIINSNLPRSMDDSSMSKYIDMSAKVGKEDNDYTGLNKVLDSLNKKTSSITDPSQKYIYLAKNLESISKADLEGAGVDTIAQVKTMVKTFLDDPKYGLKGMSISMGKTKGLKLEVLQDGKFIFSGTDADKFNSSYGISLNTALGAYSRVQNMSTKEASERFQAEYMGLEGEPTTDGTAKPIITEVNPDNMLYEERLKKKSN